MSDRQEPPLFGDPVAEIEEAQPPPEIPESVREHLQNTVGGAIAELASMRDPLHEMIWGREPRDGAQPAIRRRSGVTFTEMARLSGNAQRLFDDIVRDRHREGVPPAIIVMKPRQAGASSMAAAVALFNYTGGGEPALLLPRVPSIADHIERLSAPGRHMIRMYSQRQLDMFEVYSNPRTRFGSRWREDVLYEVMSADACNGSA